MDKHRNVSKNWHTPSFPSEAVISAYSYPYVDKSTEPFTWGKTSSPFSSQLSSLF
ncbi:DNA REPAIR PROTEIN COMPLEMENTING XP-G CELLS-RELATED [Salix koriyanagi]|uniref:DNA REPAIR PROTEIN COMPLEMENTING XP-G CELLS-RELATED n=1 Tax=Salix koriyanagi TaxID=2511006 RepID=A0A9Q0VZ98_9ROSI|nr:DNA REPAIR PROTEIN COMPLEMENTING XP-G CELLS-RELATED [Salix koriyanagi]